MSSDVARQDTDRLVRRELDPGERLVWSARPEFGPFVSAATRWGTVLFALPWTALVVFWMWGASAGYRADGKPGSLLFSLFGAPFVAVGVALLGTPLWNYLKAARTTYAITDARLIVIEDLLRHSVKSYPCADIGEVERRERSDGVGSIIFVRTVTVDGDGDKQVREIGFFGVHAVREVERLVLGVKAS